MGLPTRVKSSFTEEWLRVSPETPQLENSLELSKYQRREDQIPCLALVPSSLFIDRYMEKPWENTCGQNNQRENHGQIPGVKTTKKEKPWASAAYLLFYLLVFYH